MKEKSKNKPKILVVDDEERDLRLVEAMLAPEGYEVVLAHSGEEGLEKARESSHDVILLDIMMPNISGWEVFGELKKNPEWQKIPVIFLTARSDQMAKNAGYFLGDDYIEKPYELEAVKNRIDKILNKV